MKRQKLHRVAKVAIAAMLLLSACSKGGSPTSDNNNNSGNTGATGNTGGTGNTGSTNVILIAGVSHVSIFTKTVDNRLVPTLIDIANGGTKSITLNNTNTDITMETTGIDALTIDPSGSYPLIYPTIMLTKSILAVTADDIGKTPVIKLKGFKDSSLPYNELDLILVKDMTAGGGSIGYKSFAPKDVSMLTVDNIKASLNTNLTTYIKPNF